MTEDDFIVLWWLYPVFYLAFRKYQSRIGDYMSRLHQNGLLQPHLIQADI